MAKLQGLEELIGGLNAQIAGISNVTKKGIKRSLILVERESKKQVPLDTANLKNSWHSNVYEKNGVVIGEMGYSAVYATRQHEEIGYQHPVGKAKFLEDPIKDNTAKIVEIIKEEAHRQDVLDQGMVFKEQKQKAGVKFKEKLD